MTGTCQFSHQSVFLSHHQSFIGFCMYLSPVNSLYSNYFEAVTMLIAVDVLVIKLMTSAHGTEEGAHYCNR